MTKLHLESTTLECHEQGSGLPVVFIHGSASDYRTWDKQERVFAQRFRTLTYSRRYHWPNESIADGAEYSMSEQVHDLEQVLQSAGSQPFVVGHSYGAYLALMVAISRPGLIGRMVLAEPPVIPLFTSFPPKPQDILRLLVTDPKTAFPIIKFAATGLGPATQAAKRGQDDLAMKKFGSAVMGNGVFRRLSPERLEQARSNFMKAELLSDSFMTPIDAADVVTIETPTLIVTGANSPRLFHRLNERLADLIPNSQSVEIPNASHITHEDNPAAYNHAVLQFLE